ncbi:methyltransferase domain-containing protein [Candidatus Parcubacteria bacterium]|nr:methyltransferase domain-containing protein [Candidatus Parcubacteria bacterium]
MKYIFHLGRIPALSVAELQAMLSKTKANYSMKFISREMITIDIKNEINFKELLVQMGGTIKIAKFINSYQNFDKVFEEIDLIIKNIPGKKTIGYSFYSTETEEKNDAYDKFREIETRFKNIKKTLAGKSSVRIVFPDNKTMELNSASIFKNKLTIKGIEFNIMTSGDKIILSRTIAVQDVESYSQRDYDRPNKDSLIGMIPPKLAQIMINLANMKEGQIMLDPFCGIGTILQEALLNDYKVIGSDANDKQVKNSKTNLEWLSKKYILRYPNYKIFQSDIKNISKKIKQNSIDAIVTESSLGPVYTKIPQKIEIKQNFNRLEKMYLRFFQAAKLVLRKKARIVATLPAYKITQGRYVFAPFVDKLEKMGYSIISPLDTKLITKHTRITSRNSIIYDRPDQIVAREVIIFENR